MDISAQLSQVAGVLKDAWGFQRVVIGHNPEGAFRCRTRTNLWTFIPERLLFFLSPLAPEWYRRENRESIDYFYQAFGERRITRISNRMGLHLDAKRGLGLSLTRRDVEKLFVGLADLRLEDVEEVLGAHQYTKAEVDDAARQLVPFQRIEDIFLRNVPTFSLWSYVAGGDFEMLRQRVCVCEEARRGGPAYDRVIWDHRMAKTTLSLGQQEPGTLIPHPAGWYVYWGKAVGGGAGASFFKSITPDLHSMIKVHGTRMNPFSLDGRLSILNDFSHEIGLGGMRTIEQTVLAILGRPTRNPDMSQYEGWDWRQFRRGGYYRHAETFVGMGFSLGVPQLSHLAHGRPTLFSELILVCGPGISENRSRQWQVVRNGPAFRIIVEIDDLVHRTGGGYLAQFNRDANKPVDVFVFAPASMDRQAVRNHLLNPPLVPEGFRNLAGAFFSGFGGAHGRNTTFDEGFEYHRFSRAVPEDQAVIQRLMHDREWEALRQRIRQDVIDAQEWVYGTLREMGRRVARAY